MMRSLSKYRARLDKIGDAIGALALFALCAAGFWVAYGIGFPTGGNELLGVV